MLLPKRNVPLILVRYLTGTIGLEFGQKEIQPSIHFSGIFHNNYIHDEVALAFKKAAERKFHQLVNNGIDLRLNAPVTEKTAYAQIIWSLKSHPTKWREFNKRYSHIRVNAKSFE